jgi:hypothetical protein
MFYPLSGYPALDYQVNVRPVPVTVTVSILPCNGSDCHCCRRVDSVPGPDSAVTLRKPDQFRFNFRISGCNGQCGAGVCHGPRLGG